MDIKFDQIKYKIFMDEFSEGNMKNELLQLERLLHKPVAKSEISTLSKILGETIFQHLDFYTKKHGLRRGNKGAEGATKERKFTA